MSGGEPMLRPDFAEIFDHITSNSISYSINTNGTLITAKIAKMHCRIFEVPISYAGRDYDEGKKIGWQDGVVALWTIIKYRFTD